MLKKVVKKPCAGHFVVGHPYHSSSTKKHLHAIEFSFYTALTFICQRCPIMQQNLKQIFRVVPEIYVCIILGPKWFTFLE